MVSRGAALAFDLGAQLAFDLLPLLASRDSTGSTDPIAVSKGIALALDLGTPSCSRSPLAFDLGHQLAQEAPGSSKGASLTLYLGTSLALGANWLLVWGPIWLQRLWYPNEPQ